MANSLVFNAERHEYTTGGHVVPSVTQILQAVGIIDYSGVQDIELYARRGSAVHKAAHLSDVGRLIESSVDPVIVPYLSGWRKFRAARPDLMLAFSERMVYHEKAGYCGTLDRIFTDSRGRLFLVDLKTDSRPKWVCAQVAAYKQAFEAETGKFIFDLFAVTVKANGFSVQEVDRESGNRLWASALTAYKFIHPKMRTAE